MLIYTNAITCIFIFDSIPIEISPSSQVDIAQNIIETFARF